MAYLGNTATTQAFTAAVDYFNGNGSTTAFTLSRPVASVAQVQVVIENVPQNPGSAFSVSGNTITFTSAPPSGTSNIYVYYTSPITQVYQAISTSSAFPSGTSMLFVQTSAPTGWTKSTTHNDKALRIVSGAASTGGSVAFSTAFASGLSAGATTLTTTQIPSHGHSVNAGAGVQAGGGTTAILYPACAYSSALTFTGNTGGGGSHTHTLPSFAVSYVDVIIATAD